MCSGSEGRAAGRSPGPLVMVNPSDVAGDSVGGRPVVEVPVEVPGMFPVDRQQVVVALAVRP